MKGCSNEDMNSLEEHVGRNSHMFQLPEQANEKLVWAARRLLNGEETDILKYKRLLDSTLPDPSRGSYHFDKELVELIDTTEYKATKYSALLRHRPVAQVIMMLARFGPNTQRMLGLGSMAKLVDTSGGVSPH
jgi:hypothetical protein